MTRLLAVLGLATLLAGATAQPDADSLHLAVEDLARRAVADLVATPDTDPYQRLAVIPRDGDVSAAVAEVTRS